MLEYKFVTINKGIHNREKDMAIASEEVNGYAREGWDLKTVMSPNDMGGAIVAVLCREVEEQKAE